MRNIILGFTLVCATVLTMQCKPSSGPADTGQSAGKTVVEQQRETAKTEMKEAATATKEYVNAQKAELAATLGRDLEKIQQELDRLEAKAALASAEAKENAKVKLEVVREKWKLAKKQLDEFGNVTESNWDDVKKGVEKSQADLSESFEQMNQWAKEKLE